MTDLVIALCQLSSEGMDQQANLNKGLTACAQAAAEGADVAILPELWQIGYTPCPDTTSGRDEWQGRAIDLHDPWLSAFRKAASQLNIAIVATFLENWPDAPRNTAILIDRHGNDVIRYAKVHTCDFGMEVALTPGDSFNVDQLDTKNGPVDVGIMICYDREFPESARELMLGGAEVVLIPNACPMAGERSSQLRARAFENMTAMALANYPAPEHDGHSCAFDGMAFQRDGQPRNHLLLQAGDEPGVFYARLNIDALRAYRAHETWGDAYRKPHAYRQIGLDKLEAPVFSRRDSRRGAGTATK